MSDLDLADPELAMIINIEENKVCNDCEKKNPRWCSINNAVLLCESCGKKHSYLGYNISYFRKLKYEWDQYLTAYLERGGNSRYIRFCQQYDLTNMPIEQKLKTKIMEYYRLLVSKYFINFSKIDKIRSFGRRTSKRNS